MLIEKRYKKQEIVTFYQMFSFDREVHLKAKFNTDLYLFLI